MDMFASSIREFLLGVEVTSQQHCSSPVLKHIQTLAISLDFNELFQAETILYMLMPFYILLLYLRKLVYRIAMM